MCFRKFARGVRSCKVYHHAARALALARDLHDAVVFVASSAFTDDAFLE